MVLLAPAAGSSDSGKRRYNRNFVQAPCIHGSSLQKSKSSLDDKTRQRVGDELVRFLGECRLGDLESRLDLVRPFLHEALASGAPLRGLLFNLCHFYGQYLPAVQARIQRDREPIEKKLKVGFWAEALY